MVLPGNHEATCAEFDGPGNILTAYLNEYKPNSTAAATNLTYYSCPPSQRNFTAYQHRFRSSSAESLSVANFWYSFDYGLAHFISLDGETDYVDSPSYSFARDIAGSDDPDETHPTPSQTFVTDAGPFGAVDGGRIDDNDAYQQNQWLVADLKGVNRTRTPWVVAMSHRPMYSTETATYQAHVRAAWEGIFLEYGVDLYLAGHIHWYERTFPLGANGTVDQGSVVDNNTYYTNPGKSITHIVNGAAGNIESHSTLDAGEGLADFTVVLDQEHYGFGKLTVESETELTWRWTRGDDGSVADTLTLKKRA